MRKVIISLFLLFVLLISVFASDNEIPEDAYQDADTLHVTAYKNPPMPAELVNRINISNYSSNQITGTTDIFQINYSRTSYSNALILSVSTNRYEDINFDIYFYPFVNQYDSSDFFTVKYTISNETANQVSFTESSYDYIYSAQWNKSGFTSNYVDVTTGSGSSVTVVNKVTAQRRTGSAEYSNYNVSNKTGGIPGIGNQLITNVMKFKMDINLRNRTPEPNAVYEAKIRLVISAF